MKNILVIASNTHTSNNRKRIHNNWTEECASIYNIDFWGPGYSNLKIKDLKNKIDSFKPDFIYLTHRNNYKCWLPDISSIKVPKIFVEVDSYKWPRNNSWYSQFDSIYTRQPCWDFKTTKPFSERHFYKIYKFLLSKKNIKSNKKQTTIEAHRLYKKCLKRIQYASSWRKTPLFRWSVSEKFITKENEDRKGIYFIGRSSLKLSPERFFLCNRFKDKIFLRAEWDKNRYHEILRSASALVCPTGSIYGDYVPAKIFEFAASGAAIITNCDLNSYNLSDLQKVVIPYTDLNNLESKLDMDFKSYYNKTLPIIKNHTHRIRYRELFG